MAPFDELSEAWTNAEGALPLGWAVTGLVQSWVYDAYIRARPGALPPRTRAGAGWVAMAGLEATVDDAPAVLAIGEGQFHSTALNDLTIKLGELRSRVGR
jgi:hypothetical protein